MHDEFCSTQVRHNLREVPYTRRLTGTDIEDKSTSRRRPHCAAQRANRIADISEIPGLLAIAKNLYRFAAKQPISENGDNAGIR